VEAFETVDGWEDAIWSSESDDFSVDTVPITRWARHVNAGYGLGRDSLLNEALENAFGIRAFCTRSDSFMPWTCLE
jgi:hypothetical protein